MNTMSNCGRVLIAMAFLSFTSATWSADAPVMKSAQVTEEALINALTVDAPPAGDDGKTRGFRPAARPGDAPAKPAGPGKANLMVTFTTGSAVLTPDGSKVLDTLAKAVQSDTLAGLSFRIEGHADPRGDAARNLSLSDLRAQSVMNYLITTHGVLADRLTAVGKGSTELLDPQHPDAAENRRVTIVSVRAARPE